ncbi:hypothetical protein [Haladaptatus sp. DYF46]|uniref:VirB4 family type IV secretion system protein n=1 Tax=Haladaptatus sp. DYF46 TaxID=2886041 RepID=UPI001E56D501|nr:hypothetical protein [Haladaptatus sp. DYF46]
MTTNEDTPKDPTQLVPPYVDSSLDFHGFNVNDMLYSAPGAGLMGVSGLAALFGAPLVPSAVGAGVGALGGLGAFGLAISSDEYTSGLDRIKGPLAQLKASRTLPKTGDEAATVHGVKRIHADGTAEMEDGRLVALARISGRNTAMQKESEAREMIGRVRTELDQHVSDFSFRLFSSALEIDPRDVTEKYRSKLYSSEYAGEEWKLARELLRSVIQWTENTDFPRFDAREWQHYLVVEVRPDEVAVSDMTDESEIRSLLFGGDDEQWEAKRRRMQREVKTRLSRLCRAFGSTDGCETTQVGPAEHALLLGRYWSGTEHSFDTERVTKDIDAAVWPHSAEKGDSPRPEAVNATDTPRTGVADVARVEATTDGGTVSQPVATSTHADEDADEDTSFLAQVREGLLAPLTGGDDGGTGLAHDRVQELLAPQTFDARDGYVRTGQQYCRTYWIADWPVEPREKFLEQIYTMRGVDVDVCLDVRERDKRMTELELKDTIGEIDANIDERKDVSDVSAILVEDDLDPYVKMYKLLHHTQAQPWDLSGYVTVRAGTRQALDKAEERIEEGLATEDDLTLDIAKHRALEDDCDNVRDTLESAPAHLTVLAPEQRQAELFESCSPNGRDKFADVSTRKRYSLTLSGTIAAAFPPVSAYIDQEDGVEQGRNVQNGSEIIKDQFSVAPGHRLTIGNSGSGKSYHVGKQATRWYLAGEDRTLILCDTMGEFGSLIELLNGQHITVDGSQTINPLHIEETPEEALAASGNLDPYDMKFTEARNFILDMIGDEAGEFAPLVSDALNATYEEAGVLKEDVTTHKAENSPTMANFRETVNDMGENPGEYVDSELEKAQIQENAGPLLRRLSGFKQGGEHDALVGESEAHIRPGEVSYLDLQQIQGLGAAADKATMLQLMLGQVYQAVKRAPSKTLFVIDEAHYLFQSKEILAWLQQSARHWRHFNAGLWFLSHRPSDFASADDKDMQESKRAILGQVPTTEFFYTDKLEEEDAKTRFGMNDEQLNFITSQAKRGEDGLGYTDYLVDYADVEGWMHAQERASPFEDVIYSYKASEDGPFRPYIEDEWGEI